MRRESAAFMRWIGISLGAFWVAAGAASCRRSRPTFDSFPIPLDMSAGVPMWIASPPEGLPVCATGPDAGAAAPDGGTAGLARIAIDLGAPLTVMEFCPSEARAVLEQLEIVSARDPAIVRARFLDVPLLNVPSTSVGLELAGAPASVRRADGIAGATLLGSFSLRFSLDRAQPGGPTLQLFPDTAGSNDEHALACDAVIPFRLLGGGDIIVNGSEHKLSASRIVVAACLEPALFAGAPPPVVRDKLVVTGIDLALVVSTAVEPVLLGASTVARLDRARVAAAKPPLSFSDARVHTPRGAMAVDFAMGERLVLVEDTDDSLGPCEELALARSVEATGGCVSGSGCVASAYVEIDRPFAMARLDDEEPMLQDLRSELRGSTREIDGLLGADALRELVIDFDYPHSRLVSRCGDARGATCRARPHYTLSSREEHLECLPFSQPLPDAGLPDAADTDATTADATTDATIDDATTD